jgi:energy-converting hydrogenase Eha subunit C
MKPLLKSKVVWVNFITVVVSVAAFFDVNVDPTLAEETATFLLLVSPLINIVLRFFTKEKLTIK